MTVAAVLLVVLLDGFALCLRHAGTAEDYSQAVLLARGLMVDLENDARLAPGSRQGNFGETFARFRWEATITQPSTERWYTVEVAIVFTRRGVERTACFRTVLPTPDLVRPPQSRPTASGGPEPR